MSNPDSHRWFCSKCNKSIMIQDSKSTSNVRRHLKNSHGITIDRADEAQDAVEDEEQQPRNLALITSYLNRVDIDRFRELLVRWLVQCQIPFSAVQRSQFVDLLLCLSPSLQPYLVSSATTIRSWIKEDY